MQGDDTQEQQEQREQQERKDRRERWARKEFDDQDELAVAIANGEDWVLSYDGGSDT